MLDVPGRDPEDVGLSRFVSGLVPGLVRGRRRRAPAIMSQPVPSRARGSGAANRDMVLTLLRPGRVSTVRGVAVSRLLRRRRMACRSRDFEADCGSRPVLVAGFCTLCLATAVEAAEECSGPRKGRRSFRSPAPSSRNRDPCPARGERGRLARVAARRSSWPRGRDRGRHAHRRHHRRGLGRDRHGDPLGWRRRGHPGQRERRDRRAARLRGRSTSLRRRGTGVDDADGLPPPGRPTLDRREVASPGRDLRRFGDAYLRRRRTGRGESSPVGADPLRRRRAAGDRRLPRPQRGSRPRWADREINILLRAIGVDEVRRRFDRHVDLAALPPEGQRLEWMVEPFLCWPTTEAMSVVAESTRPSTMSPSPRRDRSLLRDLPLRGAGQDPRVPDHRARTQHQVLLSGGREGGEQEIDGGLHL